MKFRVNVVCIIENDGKVLLGKKAPGVGPYVGKWLIPGGGADLKDESLDEAMKRETREETGLIVTNFERLFFEEDVTERHGETVRLVFLYYKITDVEDWNKAKPNDDLVELKWIPFSELSTLPLPPISPKIFKRLGWMA